MFLICLVLSATVGILVTTLGGHGDTTHNHATDHMTDEEKAAAAAAVELKPTPVASLDEEAVLAQNTTLKTSNETISVDPSTANQTSTNILPSSTNESSTDPLIGTRRRL